MNADNRYFLTEAESRELERSRRPIAWYVYLLLAVLPPVGIILLWKRRGRAKIWVKAALTIASLCWMGPYFRFLLGAALWLGADKTMAIFRI